jgi:hypothetical protein
LRKIITSLLVFILLVTITGCGTKKSTGSSTNNTNITKQLAASDLFTERDLEQDVDISDATNYEVSSNKDINITKSGTYVISGSSTNTTISINVGDEDKVTLVFKNLNITNESKPVVFVKNADKVFISLDGTNTLTVTSTFTDTDDVKTDSVIFSKDDLVISGTGTLNITSTDNGITSKDDLKITGGTINIKCTSDGLEANNGVAIKDSNITIETNKDGIHAEYDEDDSKGYVYISGGTININASDDGIHATTILEIDSGTINITAHEGLEATYIQINDGTISISATDDGINAASKSKSYTPTFEFNGGTLNIDMGQGDTDAIDSNGNLIITGGTINITGQSSFDYDGEATYTGGKIIVNGTETNNITNQMMGGGGRGGMRR